MNNELKIKAYHFASWKTGSAPLPTDDVFVRRIADETGWLNDMAAVLDCAENESDELMVRNIMTELTAGILTNRHLIIPTGQSFSDRSAMLPHPVSITHLAGIKLNSETERHLYSAVQGAMHDIQGSLEAHNEFIKIVMDDPETLEVMRFWQHLHLYGILITYRSAYAALKLRSNLGVADFRDLVQLNAQQIQD